MALFLEPNAFDIRAANYGHNDETSCRPKAL